MRNDLFGTVLACAGGLAVSSLAFGAAPPSYPEGDPTPRSMTPEETAWVARNPISVPPVRSTPPPNGPVVPTSEYEPMEAIMLAWEGSGSWKFILQQMAVAITTMGDADVWIYADTTGERNDVISTLTSAGADMSRVEVLVRTTDTIWIRDYGPQYVREGGVRAAVDHTYNRPRPSDNNVPVHYAATRGHLYYDIPLVHGGGNYHLDLNGNGHATRLIANENPGLTDQQIIDLWFDYWGTTTALETPFPTFVDATQHIDMWMQICADDKVVISDWPAQSGTVQDQICDAAAADFASRGFQVTRVPARTVSGTHYTYTNVVICNDIVLVPTYTNSTVSNAGYNTQALAAWAGVFPGKTIVDINCQAIVTAAGVMHCITKHVPANLNGSAPTAYLRTPNGGDLYEPGTIVNVEWISDDDVAVQSVDIDLTTDDGRTWISVATGLARDGTYAWTVPDLTAPEARLRVVAHDLDGNSGTDATDDPFSIVGDCPGDTTTTGGGAPGVPDGSVDLADLLYFVNAWDADLGNPTPNPGTIADVTTTGGANPGVPDGDVDLSDLLYFVNEWGIGLSECP